jgi:RimJ/RimL family protein N-acetyltransferase
MDPLMIDVPSEILSERLMLRVPRAGDGKLVYLAVRNSLAELKPWMPWAHDDYGEEHAEHWCRKGAANFLSREQLQFLIFLRDSDIHIGTTGMPRLDWKVPRMEIGYWLRTSQTGRGYMTEAVGALVRMLEQTLKVPRIEIRTDARNVKSRSVAERAGFLLEGVLRNDDRDSLGKLRDTCVYSRIANPAD